MRPRMTFLHWIDAWGLDREERMHPRECFDGYGIVVKQIFIIYLRLCVLAGADGRDFEV